MAILFKTVDDIRVYLPIHKNMSFDSIKPFVESAELEYIKPLLGTTLYDALVASYNGTIAPPYTALLPYVQRPLAYYALHSAMPFLTVTLSDMGVQEQQSRDGSSAPARQFAIEKLHKQYIGTADLFAEQLLAFLEENSGTYTTWSNDTTKTKSLFIENATVLSSIVGNVATRRLYLAIKPCIQQAMDALILPCCGEDLYDTYLTEFAAGDLPEKELKYIRKAVANYAMYLAYDFLPIQITADGLTVSSYTDGLNSKAAATRKGEAQQRYNIAAMSAIRTLKEFLDENYSQISDYESTANNDEPLRYQLPDNEGKKSFMV